VARGLDRIHDYKAMLRGRRTAIVERISITLSSA
jgi:hypothetical protein